MHQPARSTCHHRCLVHLLQLLLSSSFFFFFNDTATTEIYTLSLHDALPILPGVQMPHCAAPCARKECWRSASAPSRDRSEEHTSELQSQSNLVCRLLLEKKKKKTQIQKLTQVKTNIQHTTQASVRRRLLPSC